MKSALFLSVLAISGWSRNWPVGKPCPGIGISPGRRKFRDSGTIDWDDRIFLTIAVSSDKDFLFESVLTGAVDVRTDAASQQS